MGEDLWVWNVIPCSVVIGSMFRRNLSIKLHGVTSQRTVPLIVNAVRTSNPTCLYVMALCKEMFFCNSDSKEH